ncbi:MAG: phosphodiester glycosidase family protein [Clostridia bacterium]|nr:phosphodiester glycosidase family protein [Clostridia bacterium]
MKKLLWPLLYGLLLTSFTVYVALDTFIITRIYEAADKPALTQLTGLLPTAAPPEITANSYSDENIRITLSEYREHDTTIYVADVVLSSPELLRTALARGSYGRNVSATTSEMAAQNGAILAINGDYYGSRERGYVVRNGVLYRSSVSSGAEALAIMSDGSFRIVQEGAVSAEELAEEGARHVFPFGPALLENGEISVTTADEVGKAMADNPRTAIGVYEPGHYVLLVSDGRTQASEGLSLYELAEFMQGLGLTSAYNLDGGGSSTMVFMGDVINNPTTNGRRITERSVSDIVYIGY